MRVRKTSGNEDRRCSNPEVGKSVKGGPTPTTEATETCFRANEANKPTKEQKRPTKEQKRPASEQKIRPYSIVCFGVVDRDVTARPTHGKGVEALLTYAKVNSSRFFFSFLSFSLAKA